MNDNNDNNDNIQMDGLEITVINLSVQMDVTTENVLPQTFVGKTIWSSIYI